MDGSCSWGKFVCFPIVACNWKDVGQVTGSVGSLQMKGCHHLKVSPRRTSSRQVTGIIPSQGLKQLECIEFVGFPKKSRQAVYLDSLGGCSVLLAETPLESMGINDRTTGSTAASELLLPQ